jgi:hypothetical protein
MKRRKVVFVAPGVAALPLSIAAIGRRYSTGITRVKAKITLLRASRAAAGARAPAAKASQPRRKGTAVSSRKTRAPLDALE